jgi:hypothetical protein
MSQTQPVFRDERTVAIENAGYRWGYLTLSFGILAAVMYRGFVLGQQSWDLLGLVMLGGIVGIGYQVAHNIVTRRWVLSIGITMGIAAIVAAMVAALIKP